MGKRKKITLYNIAVSVSTPCCLRFLCERSCTSSLGSLKDLSPHCFPAKDLHCFLSTRLTHERIRSSCNQESDDLLSER